MTLPVLFLFLSTVLADDRPLMEMTLTKTFLGVKVAKVQVAVDPSARAKIEDLLRKKKEGGDLKASVAQAVFDAEHVLIRMRFARNVGFGKFIDELKNGERCAFEQKLVDRPELERVETNIASWYGAVRPRGIREGDTMSYDLGRDRARVQLKTQQGKPLMDHRSEGRPAVMSILGGFFAACSDFRDGLVDSLERAR